MGLAKSKAKAKTGSKKPITYFYNPYYKNESELQFLEVWQVLEDDVLGSLYPWQYIATAETSSRIITLNFQALKNFENDYRNYFDQVFVYKVSAKLLSEGNVHRLGSILQPNLILCFDVYQLEKFGDKAALAGLKFLINIGATIMLEGVDKAPVDVLLKYPASYFLLDYRYYNSNNKGLLAMMNQLTKTSKITMVVGNVINKDNLDIFTENEINIFAGSALVKPKKRVEAFVDRDEELAETLNGEKMAEAEDNLDAKSKKKFVVQAEASAPEDYEKRSKKAQDASEQPQTETITIEVTTQRDQLKAKLAAAALARQKAIEEEAARKAAEEEAQRKEAERLAQEERMRAEEEAKRLAKQLGAGQITTPTSEFASLSKKKDKKKATPVQRSSNVIKLTVSRPVKSTKKQKSE